MKWKKLLEFNERDIIGLFGWFVVGLMLGIFAIPLMIGREIYQWKRYHLTSFEWEDVIRYSIIIITSMATRHILDVICCAT